MIGSAIARAPIAALPRTLGTLSTPSCPATAYAHAEIGRYRRQALKRPGFGRLAAADGST
jgi:hypothetical protein